MYAPSTPEMATLAGRRHWPAHRAVVWLPGSLPMGGVVADTPIHAFEQPAPERGGALFFRHAFSLGSVQHIGCQVNGPVPKYLARIHVMYGAGSDRPEKPSR